MTNTPRTPAGQGTGRELFVVLALLLAGCSGPAGDPLARLGIEVTEGAAAGYVADAECARCHGEIAASYDEVGMARSFFRPRSDRFIEAFGQPPFHHDPSDRYYQIRRDGDRLVFARWEIDDEGERRHRFEVEVDWILGSGHTSRTYLFQTPEGELYLLPLAWYSQTGRWGMAPGYDNARHLGVQRLVRQECMFCHNAYPEMPVGGDRHDAPDRFPEGLPEGIGCQRCHGPGADHIRAALQRNEEATHATVVQTGRLAPDRQADLCYSCHFQPSVALAGIRRFGRDIYSHRPEEELSSYLVRFDVAEEDQPREERFEINHHPYRLEQSACFASSPRGSLACTTCHDPHRKIPAEERSRHYGRVCASCHAAEACDADAARVMATGAAERIAIDDCVACHMPRRRTQDVVQVVMTDHRIQRPPQGVDLLAPRRERTPILVDAQLIEDDETMPPPLGGIYRASVVLRAGRSTQATDFLLAALADNEVSHQEPYSDLLRGLLGQRRFAEAVETATTALRRWPESHRIREWRGLARQQLGDREGALEDLDEALAGGGGRAETHFNRGLVLLGLGRLEEGVAALERAVELRPNFSSAWSYLGRARWRLERHPEAEDALRRALSVEPSNTQAALELARLLAATGRTEKARRLLRHAVDHARSGERALQALAALESGAWESQNRSEAAAARSPTRAGSQ